MFDAVNVRLGDQTGTAWEAGNVSWTSLLLRASRPILRINLRQYTNDVRHAPFPSDPPTRKIAGPNPDRLLFVGDVGVMGYGVLLQGMTVCHRTAQAVAANRGRGCEWNSIAAPDLTTAQLAKRTRVGDSRSDVVILMMGVPDVLLATSARDWAANLQTIAGTIRNQHGAQTPILFAAIPPLSDFRPIPQVPRDIIRRQVGRLNDATEQVAASLPHVGYESFPALPRQDSLIEKAFSWPLLHQVWAASLAPLSTGLLNEVDPVTLGT